MPGWFRLTKSKFQILSIFFNFFNSSNFIQFSQFFPFPSNFSHLSNSVNFSKFFLSPLIWFLPRAVVFFSKMITVAPKILLFFQILTVVCSCDWSWEFDRSWSGPYQKFLKLENFRRYLQLGKELESCDSFNLNCPKFPNFGKAENFFQNEKNLKKLENSSKPNFVE